MGKRVITGTTETDLANHDAGYSGNGESQWTRNVANGGGNTKLASYETPSPPAWVQPKRELPALIASERRALAKLKAKLADCSNDRRAKLAQNIDIKSTFLARLESER
jgi:hypothetical protein